ncbi:sulfotransferase family 2 domain-containing protein [uncultured Sulfitobacter sp.]|uniref:sulfotransferase family 2 domain-containing protein n=1 Tax=uncultured Sulfitobacter sp. TaxID=191468 RepID=UPI0026384F00|nr:sulfotransferase family 2 domain-containing protein [uncultured Sulfitobacter sp.]
MAITIKAHRIAYMALPKAACSTVKQTLAKIDPAYGRKFEKAGAPVLNPEHVLYPTRRFRPHRWEALEGWWRFCVVRDPAKRLISCYTNRVVQLKDLHNSRKLIRGAVDLPMDPDPDFFFQNLVAYRRAASVIKHHALPADMFLGDDLSVYDRVYPIEELDQLMKDLGARCGTDVTLVRKNKSGGGLGIEDLKPETRDSLRPHMAREYALLGGYYENPLQ